MATAAGLYKELWRPEEIGATHAIDIIDAIEIGLQKMIDDPVKYKAYNAPNGWGLYKHFVPWVSKYLEACKANPDAEIEAS